MTIAALRHIGRNVANVDAAATFYANALGFQPTAVMSDDVALAALLGVRRVRTVWLQLGGQEIELSECEPAGAAYPMAAANDLCFQHFAVVTQDIAASSLLAIAHGGVPISSGGPQKLPDSSGGVTAWKFRDPDGHPLEFLQFPEASANGARVDHTGISVSHVGRSVAFYRALGLRVAPQTLNEGPAQDALDGLPGALAEVVALWPKQATPHLELLGYRAPERHVSPVFQPGDLAADRMVFKVFGGKIGLHRDPDGHFFVLAGT